MFSKYLRQLTSLKATLLAGLALIIAGFILVAITAPDFWKNQKTAPVNTVQALKPSTPLNTPDPLVSGTPVHITISSLNIDLNVIPGYYYSSSNSWTLSLNNAQYATMTAPANNKEGDTFIYAHNRKGVFMNLPNIKPGAIAQVTTNNGHVFNYVFTNSVVTTPTDTSLFNYKGKPVLVLQTCTGRWYQNRQLFTFNLLKVDK